MEAWSGITLPFGTAVAPVRQLFPTWAVPGQTSLFDRNPGFTVRRPNQGTLHSIQVRTDGADGGYVEFWDINGEDDRVDVSTPVTPVLTQANIDALVARGMAKMIYRQDFTAGFGAATPSAPPRPFLHGLAARFVGGAGFCELNLVVVHGFVYID